MILKVKILQIICIFAMLLAAPRLTVADTAQVQQLKKGLETFGVNLFSELAAKNPEQNIVFSPFSIQTCLAMARMGAEGETALEIDQVLAGSARNIEDLANYFHNILAEYENSGILKMANKIYAMSGFPLQDGFNGLLSKKFFSAAESVDFAENVAAASAINSWVKGKTNNLITNLIDPSALDANTRLVLVNAIHFKGNWVHQFPEALTSEKEFYLDETKTTLVQMMHTKEEFEYADLSDLDAKILAMPYADSDLSMFVILPNKRSGLAELENKLKNVSLSELVDQMYSTKVIVDMPKFKAEFQADLSEPLSKLGMKRMFSHSAEFGKMLKSGDGLQVSSVVHKAFIEVNEKGTEAAAATGMLVRKKRALVDIEEIKEFNIEHPFVFKILHKTSSTPSTPATNLAFFAGKIKSISNNISSKETNLNEIKDEL